MTVNKRQPTFAALAAAIEMAAVIGMLWAWKSLETTTGAVVVTIVSLAVLTGSFFLRWYGFTRDRDRDRQWLNARAVVDQDVVDALEEAKMPVAIVRAVREVGDQPTLRRFRLQLKKQCGPELSNDQLETILHYTRTSRLGIRRQTQ
jgi:hypothetical protein